MSENAISNVKRGANVVIKPISVLTSHSTPANNAFKPKEDDHERQDVDNNGERTQGFASSVVPTLEEKTISQQQTSQRHDGVKPPANAISKGESPDGKGVLEE